MRPTIARFALASLFVPLGLAQTPAGTGSDRTFYVTNLKTPADLTGLATTLRTVLDIRQILPDEQHSAEIISADEGKLVAADWMIHQLDQPAGGDAVSPDYKLADGSGEVVRVFRLNPSVSSATLTSMVTVVRTIADVQRLMPMETPKAIVARGPLQKVDAAEWLFRQCTPPDGKLLTGDSAPYPWPRERPELDDEIIQVFRMDPSATNAAITSLVTTIRTIADVQRLMPSEFGKAVVLRASANRVAVAEWLVHELIKPSHPDATAETKMRVDPRDAPHAPEDVVRVFYVHGTSTEVTALMGQIRATAQIQRAMAYFGSVPPAVVLRARADQIATAELVVKRFGSDAAENAPVK